MRPAQLRKLTDGVLEMASAAEVRIIEKTAARLNRGLAAADWDQRKRLELGLFQAVLLKDIDLFRGRTNAQIIQSVVRGYDLGAADGMTELVAMKMVRRARRGRTTLNTPSVHALVQEVMSGAGSVLDSRAILRQVSDVYREVVEKVAGLQLLGVDTRRQVASQALQKFADKGIVAFRDRAGRNWTIGSYVDMATRTAARRAYVAGKTDTYADHQQQLVIVSDHGQECAICRPWEGKVLGLDGWDGDDASDGVRPAATLSEARGAGLFHPGCRHTIGVYIPGFTKAPTNTADPQGDADRQKLRGMERQVRKWKRREAASLTPVDKARAQAKVRAWQGKIRDHTATTSAKRQRDREQIGWDGKRGVKPRPPEPPKPPTSKPAGPKPPAGPRSPAPKPPAPKPPAPKPLTRMEQLKAEMDKLPADKHELCKRKVTHSAEQVRQRVIDNIEAAGGSREYRVQRLATANQRVKDLTDEILHLERNMDGPIELWPRKWPADMLPFARKHGIQRRTPASGLRYLDEQKQLALNERVDASRSIKAYDDTLSYYDAEGWSERVELVDDINPVNGMLGDTALGHLRTIRVVGNLIDAEIEDRLAKRYNLGALSSVETEALRVKMTKEVLGEIRPVGGGARPVYTKSKTTIEGKPANTTDAQFATLKGEMEYAHGVYPSDWNTAAAKIRGNVELGLEYRGYNQGGGQKIVLSLGRTGVDPLREVAIHELGHTMERAVPGLRTVEWAYHYQRGMVQGPDGKYRLAPQKSLGYGRSNFGEEMAVYDEWRLPYTGRVYGGEKYNGSSEVGWEVFTTGVESVLGRSEYMGVRSRGTFDYDFRKMILGVLGAL